VKIVSLDIYRFGIPLHPPQTVAGRFLEVRRGLLLRAVLDGGAEGWGEVSPLPGFSRESLEDAERQVRELRRAWVGRDPEELPPAESLLPSVAFGLEGCFLCAVAASCGQSLRASLGGGAVDRVPICGYVGDASRDLRGAAARLRAGGYTCAKLKVGRGPVPRDVAAVREAARELGPGVRLRLDANRAWSMEDATAFCEGLAGLPVEFVEEPLRDPRGLPRLASVTGVPLAVDETAVESGERLWEICEGFSAVVLKPTLLGGIGRTMRMAKAAAERGCAAVISSSFESGVGTLTLAEVAAAASAAAAGLDPVLLYAQDVLVSGLKFERGHLDLTDMNIGKQTVDRQRLDRIGDD
jgi:o-succinylbenzoate synthase